VSLAYRRQIRTRLCLLAIKIPNRRFHAALACFAVLFEIIYIFNRHPTIT
jgi:hypothetical protein